MAEIRSPLCRRLVSMCMAVLQEPSQIGVYSTGEQCAIALILGRMELKPGWTAIEAAQRVIDGAGADDWMREMRVAQRILIEEGYLKLG